MSASVRPARIRRPSFLELRLGVVETGAGLLGSTKGLPTNRLLMGLRNVYHHHHLAAVASDPNHGSGIVREHARHRRQITDVQVHYLGQESSRQTEAIMSDMLAVGAYVPSAVTKFMQLCRRQTVPPMA